MIQSLRKISLGILAVILLTTGLTAHAQRRATRNSDRQVGPILQRIENQHTRLFTTVSAHRSIKAGGMARGGKRTSTSSSAILRTRRPGSGNATTIGKQSPPMPRD